MGRGMTINCSMIEQNGEYEIGLNYNDSDGVNIDFKGISDDVDSLFSELVDDFITDYLKQTKEKEQTKEEKKESDKKVEDNLPRIKELEKIIEDLKAENYSLKVDNNVLQQRADDAVNGKKGVKNNSYKKIVYHPSLVEMLDRIFY